MSVFIPSVCHYDDSTNMLGVFSTFEKAEEAIMEVMPRHGILRELYSIEEYAVDGNMLTTYFIEEAELKRLEGNNFKDKPVWTDPYEKGRDV